MTEFHCERCSSPFHVDVLPPRGAICFKCHLRTIEIGFTHGKEAFSGPTIGERQRKTVEDAKKNGIDAVPAGTRWV